MKQIKMGNTVTNSVQIPVSTTITSMDARYWYCNHGGVPDCNYFCTKAWQGGGKLNAAVALFAGGCDAVDGITVYGQ
jgi:hypothetical protein